MWISEYKIGDKVTCKQNYIWARLYYEKNKIYTIKNIDGPHYDASEPFAQLLINSEYYETSNILFDKYKFQKYFYSRKELRQLKLQQINESTV